jgi:hypothetical protein
MRGIAVTLVVVAAVVTVTASCGGVVDDESMGASEPDPCAQLGALRARLEARGCAATDLVETLGPTASRSCAATLQAVAACAQQAECSTNPIAASCPAVTIADAWTEGAS